MEWDYTGLAEQYSKRAPYSDLIVRAITRIAGGESVCDIGAGPGTLGDRFVAQGYDVVAVEPNDDMRSYGQEKSHIKTWIDASGENTTLRSDSFDIVTFGSSFNVTNRPAALIETHRLLKNNGWFVCLWNHRDLSDPIQEAVQQIIEQHIDYGHGSRREDQTNIIKESGLFDGPIKMESDFMHSISAEDYMKAWSTHVTLKKQAGDKFESILQEIKQLTPNTLKVPYKTVCWMARK